MYRRYLESQLLEALADYPAVALLGARQVGKTTLARELGDALGGTIGGALGGEQVASPLKAYVYLDLERPSDVQKLADPEAYLALHADKLVILDEVQRAPQLFAVLRSLIDEGRDVRRSEMGCPEVGRSEPKARANGRFLLLGSASGELLKQSGESLAGRISYLELSPLSVLEVLVKAAKPTTSEVTHVTNTTSAISVAGAAGVAGAEGTAGVLQPPGAFHTQQALWLRGGFPQSFMAPSAAKSLAWRHNLITTYLERDLPSYGARLPAQTLRRLWAMLAHSHGGLFDVSQLSRALMLDAKTVHRYVDMLCDLMLLRCLQPWHSNVGKRLVKSPKVYVRDSGLLHALLGLDSLDALLAHPAVGASFEGFVLETLIACAPREAQYGFYRSSNGAEVDLLVDIPGRGLVAVEVKKSASAKPRRGFYAACEDLKPAERYLVHGGTDPEIYPVGDGVQALSLHSMALRLQAKAA